jgi:hypothetical protein
LFTPKLTGQLTYRRGIQGVSEVGTTGATASHDGNSRDKKVREARVPMLRAAV